LDCARVAFTSTTTLLMSCVQVGDLVCLSLVGYEGRSIRTCGKSVDLRSGVGLVAIDGATMELIGPSALSLAVSTSSSGQIPIGFVKVLLTELSAPKPRAGPIAGSGTPNSLPTPIACEAVLGTYWSAGLQREAGAKEDNDRLSVGRSDLRQAPNLQYAGGAGGDGQTEDAGDDAGGRGRKGRGRGRRQARPW
jgi:hypothetical protein